MPKALIYFQHNPVPPRTGAHFRVLCVLKALKEIGYDVHLFGSTLLTDTIWSDASITELRNSLGVTTEVYRGSPADLAYTSGIDWVNLDRRKWGRFAPRGLRKAIARTASNIAPDLFINNYTFFGDIAADIKSTSCRTLMESLDLFSLSAQMQKLIASHLGRPPFDYLSAPAFLLNEAFLGAIALAPWPEEYAACNQYDITTAVAPYEVEMIRRHAPKTNACYLPITATPVEVDNNYSSNPIFVAAYNLVNTQGLLYFQRHCIPLIRLFNRTAVTDVVGSICKVIKNNFGLRKLGFVDNISSTYKDAAFAICPLIGATGQQIKVVEAMAHGLAVIIMHNVADSSPVKHGVNGYIAHNSEEFAYYYSILDSNRTLCRQMGETARETIQSNWSQTSLTSRLDSILKTHCSSGDAPSATTLRRSRTASAPTISIVVIPSDSYTAFTDSLSMILDWDAVEFIFCKCERTTASLIKESFPYARTVTCTNTGSAIRRARGRYVMFLSGRDSLQPGFSKATETLPAKPRIIATVPCLHNGKSSSLYWSMPLTLFRKKSALLPSLSMVPGVKACWFIVPTSSIRAMLHKRLQDRTVTIDALLADLLRSSKYDCMETMLAAASFPHDTNEDICQTNSHSIRQPMLRDSNPQNSDGLSNCVQALHNYWTITHPTNPYTAAAKREEYWIRTIVQYRWALLGLRSPTPPARVCLFGAGTHTHWLLKVIKGLPGPKVVGILDDYAKPGQSLHGIPVLQANLFPIQSVDAVILSTDCRTKLFKQRCKDLYKNKIAVWQLYEGLPPGPYPKTFSHKRKSCP